MKSRLFPRIAGNDHYRKWYALELVKATKCRLMKPQRQIKLSCEEEQLRCQLTWQQFDCRLWDVAFADEATIKRMVVDAQSFIQNREDAVLGFSDQVHWWGWVSQAKQLYAEWEYQEKGSAGVQGMMHNRGHDNNQANKFGITVELRQVILNYFSADKNPVGYLGRSLVVVGGAHARFVKHR